MPGGTKDNSDTQRAEKFNEKLREDVKRNDQANRNSGGTRKN